MRRIITGGDRRLLDPDQHLPHRSALEATEPGDPRTDNLLVLNLGSGRGFGVREVIAEVERVLGERLDVREGPRRGGDPPALVAKIDRARDVLGWTPKQSSLEEMIGSAWEAAGR